MKLLNFDIGEGVILAPMAGISDGAFRLLLREHGLKFAVTEMISSRGIVFNNRKTMEFLNRKEEDYPLSVQLFGNEPEVMAKAAKRVEDMGVAEVIDINMGCPARKIFANSDGSRLMKDEKKAAKIVEEIKKKVKLPVSVKCRIGIDDESINLLSFVKAIESAGADFIAVHGRTKKQMYSGEANWDIIGEAKIKLNIPLIGNGDLNSLDDAKEKIKIYGVDAVMIGRGFRGNPFLIENRTVSNEEKIRVMRRHLELMIEEKGEKRAVIEFRKHIVWYTKGMRGGAKFRRGLSNLNSLDEFEKLAKTIVESSSL